MTQKLKTIMNYMLTPAFIQSNKKIYEISLGDQRINFMRSDMHY